MTQVTTNEDFDKAKSRDLITLNCEGCGSNFSRPKNQVMSYKQLIASNVKPGAGKFCGGKCASLHSIKAKNVPCAQCGAVFRKRLSEILRNSKTKKDFCSKRCAGLYLSRHKTHGTRRSKLESWLELKLTELYPKLEIHFNKRDAIQAELDIYIPSLKLAVELNGIFHYEAIYGTDKLRQTQNNDQRKLQACAERGISFCIIDTSSQKYFKPENSKKFLDIIVELIERPHSDLNRISVVENNES